MEPERLQAIAARDQLWSSLRALLPDIERLAGGGFDGGDRDRQLLVLLARIVSQELRFRADEARPGDGGEGESSPL